MPSGAGPAPQSALASCSMAGPDRRELRLHQCARPQLTPLAISSPLKTAPSGHLPFLVHAFSLQLVHRAVSGPLHVGMSARSHGKHDYVIAVRADWVGQHAGTCVCEGRSEREKNSVTVRGRKCVRDNHAAALS